MQRHEDQQDLVGRDEAQKQSKRNEHQEDNECDFGTKVLLILALMFAALRC